ncbi:MAG: glycoside hydrolase family 16 protein [Verrucomicrobiales bacterium]|nr:glycoside hydrolase family 16 protein [Verrucomicrobiales bacterium]
MKKIIVGCSVLMVALSVVLANDVPFVDYRQVKKTDEEPVAAINTSKVEADKNTVSSAPEAVTESQPRVVPKDKDAVPEQITSPLGVSMKLKFHDEFDGVLDADGQRYVDRSKWLTTFWQGDSERSLWEGNKEVGLYVDKDFPSVLPREERVNPFSFEKSGVLTINATKFTPKQREAYVAAGKSLGKWYWKDLPYASGLLVSDGKFTFTYGYVEARLKLLANRGAWPAFWMLPNHDGKHPWPPEIDILEFFGHRPTTFTSHIILPKGEKVPGWKITWYGGQDKQVDANGKKVQTWATLRDKKDLFLTEDFHTWAVEWNEKEMAFFFDGKELARGDISGCPSLHKPMYLLINLAIGGRWFSDESWQLGQHVGPADVDEASMPWKMECDYVRVYQAD